VKPASIYLQGRQLQQGLFMNYQQFLDTKSFIHQETAFSGDIWEPSEMFPFQRDCVEWALKRGKSALFLDTGLGKTITQLTWAKNVTDYTNKPVLIVAPLCVSHQTVREGEKFGIDCCTVKDDSCIVENTTGVYVTNYEMLKNFNSELFAGIVLDESSILKGMQGSIRKMITEFAKNIPFRLSCTATPSPNDFMELGSQSEFIGLMSQVEMLAMFFIHDGADTAKWRLKGHGKSKFWEWLATWSIVLRSPSDIGYDGSDYHLPEINYCEYIIDTVPTDDMFVTVAQGLQERNKARKESVEDRCKQAAEIANSIDDHVLIWCNLNNEGELLESLIDDSVNVYGSMKPELKEKNLLGFTDGEVKKLISKPSIAGFGMNWQHCNQVIFVGLSDSWEKYYQAIRRCWRFGQQRQVTVHIVSADTEGAVVANIKRKEAQNKEMGESMANHMQGFTVAQIQGAKTEKTDYMPSVNFKLPSFI